MTAYLSGALSEGSHGTAPGEMLEEPPPHVPPFLNHVHPHRPRARLLSSFSNCNNLCGSCNLCTICLLPEPPRSFPPQVGKELAGAVEGDGVGTRGSDPAPAAQL